MSSTASPIDSSGSRVVLIMAKQPAPGLSKTRLQPAVSLEEAAELSECFILDAIDLVSGCDLASRGDLLSGVGPPGSGARVVVAGTPAESIEYFQRVAQDAGFVEQSGADLSERLHGAMSDMLTEGFDQVFAINSDSPTLPSSLLTRAFEELSRPDVDVVIGPAEDGGYYLIGWKRANDHLIRDVTMSTPTVLADTLAVAAAEGLTVELLASWYDVDNPRDLLRLQAEIAAGEFCGPNTKRFFASLPEPLLGLDGRSLLGDTASQLN